MRRRVLGFGDCCYHIVSRINERRYYLGEEQKRHFLHLLYASADFSGVEILTFCIMDDHFHLLVRVPTPKMLSNAELLRRIKALYKPDEFDALQHEFQFYLDAKNRELEYSFRKRFERRMHNLSEFVRTLKHRFSLWYNRTYDREGPLWTGPFTSVLVQSSPDEYGRRSLCAVAAYIDLNAVRADLVKNAEQYPWCGFSRAVSGDKKLQKGLKYVLERVRKGPFSSKKALNAYQVLLSEVFLAKIVDFSKGWIIGSASFVDFTARRRPECFKTGNFDVFEEISTVAAFELFRIRHLRPYFPLAVQSHSAT